MSSTQPSLPANRGFVVQIHAESNVGQGQWKGRVEHVVSGTAQHFESLKELQAFIIQVLALQERKRVDGQGAESEQQ